MKGAQGLLRRALDIRTNRFARKIGLAGVVILPVIAAYALFLWSLPRPRIWVDLAASTEKLSFIVVNPELAVLQVSGMRAASSSGLTGCVDGVAKPVSGARIEYRRGNADFYRIIVDPASPAVTRSLVWTSSGAPTIREVDGSVLFEADKTCSGGVPSRLPIWGQAEFGEGVTPADQAGKVKPGVLTRGSIRVYAHAQERILGMSFPASIYLVTTFELPSGAVLTSVPGGAGTIWSGVATLPDRDGFEVHASSSGASIALTAPRTFDSAATAPQRIDMERHAQFLKDPNVVQIQVLAGAFLFLLQAVFSVISFFQDEPARSEKPEHPPKPRRRRPGRP